MAAEIGGSTVPGGSGRAGRTQTGARSPLGSGARCGPRRRSSGRCSPRAQSGERIGVPRGRGGPAGGDPASSWGRRSWCAPPCAWPCLVPLLWEGGHASGRPVWGSRLWGSLRGVTWRWAPIGETGSPTGPCSARSQAARLARRDRMPRAGVKGQRLHFRARLFIRWPESPPFVGGGGDLKNARNVPGAQPPPNRPMKCQESRQAQIRLYRRIR